MHFRSYTHTHAYPPEIYTHISICINETSSTEIVSLPLNNMSRGTDVLSGTPKEGRNGNGVEVGVGSMFQ